MERQLHTIRQLARSIDTSSAAELLHLADLVANWNIDVKPGHAEYMNRAVVVAEARRVAEKVGLMPAKP